MRKCIIYIMLCIIMCFVITGCESTDVNTPDINSPIPIANLDEGFEILEGYEVIEVLEKTTSNLYGYKIVDTETNVIYLLVYRYNSNASSFTITPLYTSDGKIMKNIQGVK